MFKKITACLVAILVISAWIPVYASTDNVTKDIMDLTGLQMFWDNMTPNENGMIEHYSLNIIPSEEKPEHFILYYNVDYNDAVTGYSSGGRYFSAVIPKGDFDFKNKAKDTLDFIAELAGSTKIEDGDYDGEYEVVAETKCFELHATIAAKSSLMLEQHAKTTDTKTISKMRGDSWPATVSGSVDGTAIQDFEGNLSTLIWATTTISLVKPAPEPEPTVETKTAARVAKGITPESGKPDVTDSRIFQIFAGAGGMKDFEYTDEDGNLVTGTGSYSWNFNIQLSNGQYYITITKDEYVHGMITRVFQTKVPESAIAIPTNFTGAMTLDLNLVGDVEQITEIWHYGENPEDEYSERITETFKDVPLTVHLVLDTKESGSGKFVMKGTTVESKVMQKGSSSAYSGMPSGTVNGENIGDGYYADLTIGKYTTRTKG